MLQYAILFTEFVELTTARSDLGDDDDKTKKLMHSVCRDAKLLSEAQIDWGINRNEIRFKKGMVLVPDDNIMGKAMGVACLMDQAVLRHELAHHFLGHTGKPSALSAKLAYSVAKFLSDQDVSAQHRSELEADLCGIYLLASKKIANQAQREQTAINVLLGTLIMETALAQLKANVYLDSPSHPSWSLRYAVSQRALRAFFDCKYLQSIQGDVVRFQTLLYAIQGRGLGVLLDK